MTTDKFLTPVQVARRLQVHPRTVRRWIQADKLKATALPGRGSAGVEYRIAEADLQTFLNGHKAAGNE